MAKDYFQDIVPPEDDGEGERASAAPHAHDRSIRNINITPRTRGSAHHVRPVAPDGRGHPAAPHSRSSRRSWLWVLTGACVFALLLLAFLFVFRKTSVMVVPQSQPVVFDQSTEFTAYPAASAPSNTLSYTVQTTDLEDFEVVRSNGSEHAETKATGSITIVNTFSLTPVKLVKDTRFATPSGLIFKAPAAIVIPGRSSSPGKVSVTVVAEKAGTAYNIGPADHLSLPGLKSNAPMYQGVYAYSVASTTGGFSGSRPAVAQADLDAALATLRVRLHEKATAFAASQASDTATALDPQIVFTDMPSSTEGGASVRVHEAAHVEIPVIPSDAFASAVGRTVAANAASGEVKLLAGEGFSIQLKGSTPLSAGEPITFSIKGQAQIIWVVDTKALAEALAGRNKDAFPTIVANFPGVQSANARVEPFWENTFPNKATDILITVAAATSTK